MDIKNKALTKTIWSADSYWKPKPSTLLVLCVFLFVFGVGEGLLVLASLGASPWAVLAQGISLKTDINIGISTLAISILVMLTWIPFEQKLGLGTVLNALLIALGIAVVQFFPPPEQLVWRYLLAVLGVVLVGISTAFYLTCHMGAGPRDGLMMGLYQMTGLKISVIRTAIEVVVCFIGWLLGGVVGVSTLLFAFGVGWVLQVALSAIIWFHKK